MSCFARADRGLLFWIFRLTWQPQANAAGFPRLDEWYGKVLR